MRTVTRILSLAALALAPLGSAHATSEPVSIACGVVDAKAFTKYVETYNPTLVELKMQINCLQVVMPGQIVNQEYRSDNSRFFAEFDKHGRIVGGRFG